MEFVLPAEKMPGLKKKTSLLTNPNFNMKIS